MSEITTRPMTAEDWPYVSKIYLEGIATEHATFQTTCPPYTAWDASHTKDCRLVVLDNGAGTGQVFDWSLLKGFPRPYLLAGGLNPDNLPQAAALGPVGVDLSSGVETDGKKDEAKILAAVAAARRV